MNVRSKSDQIHLVFASDAHYVMPLTVAMCSVAANCDRRRSLVFNIVQDRIDLSLRAKVERSLRRIEFPDVQINWLDMPSDVASFETGHDWITPVTFVRLLIPQLLPVQVDKALYLDCDIVAREDLSELWDIPLGGRSLLASRDTIGTVSNQAGLSNYEDLGIPADAKYFNAGVLVMNLRKWRTCDTTKSLLSYMQAHRDIIKHADQEVLNAVLFDDWGELDYRWNWQITWRGVRMGTHGREWTPGTTRKSIVHFITGEKPWLPGCDYEEKRYFFEYLDRTEWAGWRVPVWREVYGRAIRRFADARNSAGRLRQLLKRKMALMRKS